MKNLWLIIALALCIAIIIGVQFLTPTLYGADGYLHIRMAEFIKQGGVLTSFHWARYSWFAERFADKDLFYHILLIPFTSFRNIFLGAKIASCFFACLFLFTFLFLLRRYAPRWLVPILLLAPLASSHFLVSLSRPRSMILAITLGLLGIHFLINRKTWAVFFTTLFYCLSHLTSPLMLFYAFVCETTRWITQRQFCKRNIAAVVAGLAAGLLLHPNFPNNIFILYLNLILVPFYAAKTGILELGAEFFPMNTREYLFNYPLVLIGLFLMMLIGLTARPRTEFRTRVLFIFAAVYLLGSFLSQRYIVHGYPIILLWFASYLSDWSRERPFHQIYKKQKSFCRVIIISGSIAALLLGMHTYKDIRQSALGTRIFNTHYEQVGAWMRKNIPPGELIFHANWSDSQYLIGLNPKNDYFMTLDPVYMYHWNPEMYKEYRELAFGRIKDPYKSLRDTFKVRFGYAGKNHFSGLIERIRQDPRLVILAEDGFGVIFEVR